MHGYIYTHNSRHYALRFSLRRGRPPDFHSLAQPVSDAHKIHTVSVSVSGPNRTRSEGGVRVRNNTSAGSYFAYLMAKHSTRSPPRVRPFDIGPHARRRRSCESRRSGCLYMFIFCVSSSSRFGRFRSTATQPPAAPWTITIIVPEPKNLYNHKQSSESIQFSGFSLSRCGRTVAAHRRLMMPLFYIFIFGCGLNRFCVCVVVCFAWLTLPSLCSNAPWLYVCCFFFLRQCVRCPCASFCERVLCLCVLVCACKRVVC